MGADWMDVCLILSALISPFTPAPRLHRWNLLSGSRFARELSGHVTCPGAFCAALFHLPGISAVLTLNQERFDQQLFQWLYEILIIFTVPKQTRLTGESPARPIGVATNLRPDLLANAAQTLLACEQTAAGLICSLTLG